MRWQAAPSVSSLCVSNCRRGRRKRKEERKGSDPRPRLILRESRACFHLSSVWLFFHRQQRTFFCLSRLSHRSFVFLVCACTFTTPFPGRMEAEHPMTLRMWHRKALEDYLPSGGIGRYFSEMARWPSHKPPFSTEPFLGFSLVYSGTLLTQASSGV